MNKTTTLQENTSHTGLLFGTAVMAVLAFSLFGIQSAQAAISTQLDFGARGAEVTELQTYLATNANMYPSGLVTGYFGPLTKAGVERYQTAHGIVSSGTPLSTGYGRIGPITMASINAQLAGGGTPSGDVSAPTIKSVDVATDRNGATITWTTSGSSFGKVYYHTSPIRISNAFDSTNVFSGEPVVNGTLAQSDGAARVTHTVNINDLTPNTRYFYLVVAFDSAKNVSFTTPASFRTTQ